MGLTDLLTYAHNLILKPHSVPTSLRVVGLKQYRNDLCGLVYTVLLVQHWQLALLSRWNGRDGTYLLTYTHTKFQTSLHSYITGHCGIKTVPQ